MGVLKGDYIGFSYNGVHSSDLGIVRTSDGSRFNENLLPTVQDKTVPVPGGDGTYYFGSYYTQRQFSVSFAFDSLTEEQIARIKQVFGDKQIHDLIFDEVPYKVWSAKVTGTATIKYIPFAEGVTNRIYKGEGTIQFTCYYPFARCWSTKKNDYKNHRAYQHYDEDGKLVTDENWEERLNEWWKASHIDDKGNFGDVPVPFTKEISGADTTKTIQFGKDKASWENKISWEKMPTDISGTLNTKTGLVLDENGNILNRYISGNSTLKIPVGATESECAGLTFTCLYI